MLALVFLEFAEVLVDFFEVVAGLVGLFLLAGAFEGLDLALQVLGLLVELGGLRPGFGLVAVAVLAAGVVTFACVVAVLDAFHELVDFAELATELFGVLLLAVLFVVFDLLAEVVGLLFKLVVAGPGFVPFAADVVVAVPFAGAFALGMFAVAFSAFLVFAFAVAGEQAKGGGGCNQQQGGEPSFHVGALIWRLVTIWGLDVRMACEKCVGNDFF